MNANRFAHTLIVTTAASLTALFTTGCPKKNVAALISDRTISETISPNAVTSDRVAASETDAAPNRWIDIKGYTYDTRARFFAGLEKLEAQVDQQIEELKAKRATMNSTVDTKDWDFAMKEMGNSRAYLKAMGEEARKATPELWDQLKDKVGQAWVRTQEAYSKVKASTTL